MHTIEPYYKWRDEYIGEEDPSSPFYGMEYSEFEFSQKLYNYYIHPQWDQFGSGTLFIKILMADYEQGYCIIELLGEWNDCLGNDIMFLKREIADSMMMNGISKFIIIGENVLNFHYSEEDYYQEWFEDALENNGWIILTNLKEHVRREMMESGLGSIMELPATTDYNNWRTYRPEEFFRQVDNVMLSRLV